MNPVKRSFDIAFALCLGILLVPVLLCICIAMKLTSPGPLLFRQKRLGVGGEVFLMNKFRKFPSDWGSQGPGVTLQHDSRMTKIGQILERSKLDELPQLWNILRGEMSFVGPRPESLRYRHLFTDEFAKVLDYTPGIFGPNQTKYRNESAMYPDGVDPDKFYETELFPKKAHADLEYSKRANFGSDMVCIFTGTFAIVFSVIVWRKSMRSSVALLLWDIIAVAAAWTITHWLKYSVVGAPPTKSHIAVVFAYGFVVVPLALIVIFGFARVYRHPVSFFSETDFYRLVGATSVVWIVTAITLRILLSSTTSLVLAVSAVLSVFLMVIPRVVYKEWRRIGNSGGGKHSADAVNVVVCGISSKSIELCNLLSKGFRRARIVGILADDGSQIRREIHGFEVLGQPSDLEVLHTRYDIDQIWVGSSFANEAQSQVKSWCENNHVDFMVLDQLPGFRYLSNPHANEALFPARKSKNRTVSPADTKSESVA